MKSRVVSGTVFVTSLRPSPASLNESSTVGRPLERSTIVRMIALVFSTGHVKALQVVPLPLNALFPTHAKGRSIGRGVLIDYATWADKRGIKYSTFSTHQVRLTDILEIAKENDITFQKGDILFVRVGVTKEWDTVMTDAQKQAYSDNSNPEHAGVEATEDVLRWLWDSGFAAIASDAISWEVRYPENAETDPWCIAICHFWHKRQATRRSKNTR